MEEIILSGKNGNDLEPVDDAVFEQIADLFQYDASKPLNPLVLGSWFERQPYITEKVMYDSIHGERVPGYFAIPGEGGCGKMPAILLVHGSNGFWGKNEDWVMDWLQVLTQAGFCVLTIDNYGFGERMKKPESSDIDGDIGPYEERDDVVQSVVDLRRGIDYLLTREEVDGSKIGLLGGSRGGWLGAMTAGLESRLSAVVLTVIAYSSGNPGNPYIRYKHTFNFVPRISAPVMLVTAQNDKPERVGFSKEIFPLIRTEKRHVWYETGHYIPPKSGNREILEWFHQYLG